jgi:hypothetical protein
LRLAALGLRARTWRPENVAKKTKLFRKAVAVALRYEKKPCRLADCKLGIEILNPGSSEGCGQ